MPCGDQRADLGGRVERIADRQRLREGRDGLDDGVVPAPRGQDAGTQPADLPVVEQGGAEERLEARRQGRAGEGDPPRLAPHPPPPRPPPPPPPPPHRPPPPR